MTLDLLVVLPGELNFSLSLSQKKMSGFSICASLCFIQPGENESCQFPTIRLVLVQSIIVSFRTVSKQLALRDLTLDINVSDLCI